MNTIIIKTMNGHIMTLHNVYVDNENRLCGYDNNNHHITLSDNTYKII